MAKLFKIFFKIGLNSFGGLAAVAYAEKELVEREKLLTKKQFLDGLALAQMLPGPVGTGVVAYCGYRLKGVPGAIVALTAFLIPAFVSMLILTILYFKFGKVSLVQSIFKGLGSIVVALIIKATFDLSKSAMTDFKEAIIAALSFIIFYFLKINLFALVFIAGFASILLHLGGLKDE